MKVQKEVTVEVSSLENRISEKKIFDEKGKVIVEEDELISVDMAEKIVKVYGKK